MRTASTLWCSAFLSAMCAQSACKEPMHPPQESTETSEAEPRGKPNEPAKPAETPAPVHTAQPHEQTADGYEVIRAKTGDGQGTDVAVKAPPGWKVASAPDSPDPHGGKFTLPEALKGLPAQGKLTANIRTSLGSFQCQLFEDKAPLTVANFVGLARGLRKFWSAKDHAWVARPYYDGTTFHRVIPEFMIQGGDWAGDGSGNMYYTIPDELHPTLKHDRGGLLCMANRGPNTNEAQFFIMETAAAHLDSSYTIFGECSPVELVRRIARVPQSGPPNNRPLTPVVLERVSIERKTGAATAPQPAPVAPKTEPTQAPTAKPTDSR